MPPAVGGLAAQTPPGQRPATSANLRLAPPGATNSRSKHSGSFSKPGEVQLRVPLKRVSRLRDRTHTSGRWQL